MIISKKELKEEYEQLIKEYSLRIDSNEKKFANNYLMKALHNLELAGVLDLLSKDDEIKKTVGISTKSEYHDWVIITSYYAMYLAATSALAKLGIKSSTHRSSIIALEYRYCIEKNLLDRKYIDMIENASFGRDDIQKLDQALRGRVSVQYTVSQRYGINEAKRILKDAKEFVNKLSEMIQ
ncbi:HEPN domain-containing protein [Candidatus Woesearchaeota archaeon]|nr:HEPN domain-containing protein [Candidatus Woesearchaeota archaeon]